MKILWVTPFLPHERAPHAGGQAVHRWLSAAAGRHAVTLVCRLEPHERPALAALVPVVRAVHPLVFARPPAGLLQAVRIAASYVRLGRLATRVLRDGDFDLVHVDWLEAGLAVGGHARAPRVVVAVDELTKPARRRVELAGGPLARPAAWLAWRVAVAVQRRVCRAFDAVLALSELDRRNLLALDKALTVTVIPFPIGIGAAPAGGIAREAERLLFVGAMNRDVNVDAMTYFCREILPLVRKERPDARLTIAGASPTEEVRRLGGEPGIEVTGFVTALEPYYARATAFVSPLRIAGGIITKNLDAMAAGCAVVTSTIGNDGIRATPGTHLLTADGAQAFARAVVAVLGDAALRARLGDAGREFVRARFGIEASATALERVHRSVAAAPRAARRAAGLTRR